MNSHNRAQSVLAIGVLVAMAALGQPAHAAGKAQVKFKRIPTQFIAALSDPRATSGSNAQSWGLWREDPGPRGVRLDRYPQLKAAGTAPAQWKFDDTDWWLEEHGLIMERPDFPLPAGRYRDPHKHFFLLQVICKTLKELKLGLLTGKVID